MASDLETLRDLLGDLLPERPDIPGLVIAAGCRPPARVITSPTELDALPVMSIVLAYGVAHQSVPADLLADYGLKWCKPTGLWAYTSVELLNACRGEGVTVLYTPEEETDCG